MMQKIDYSKTVQNFEELFELIMKLYWSYISNLETYTQTIPETDIEKLNLLNEHMQEVQSALEHDISIFEKAIGDDLEDIHQVQDQLKINQIYQKLKK